MVGETPNLRNFEPVHPNNLREGELSSGLATSSELEVARLQVVTDRYSRAGYLDAIGIQEIDVPISEIIGVGGESRLKESVTPEQYERFREEGLILKDSSGVGVYLDKYHWQSIPFVVVSPDGVIGSARLILKEGTEQLPTLEGDKIPIEPEWQDAASAAEAEFSQFAVVRGSSPGASLSLLRAAHLYSVNELGIDRWVATTDNHVVGYLNGAYLNFGLPAMGPSVHHLGSESTPVMIDFEDALGNAEKSGNPMSYGIAKFIRGEMREGFDWYREV